MIIDRPRARITVCREVTTKQFFDSQAYQTELRWYTSVPWAAPELLLADSMNHTLQMRTHELSWGARFDRQKVANKLYALLSELERSGVHHRDVHPRNIVLDGDTPLLIDWECAVYKPGVPSYDLYGPAVSGIAPPQIHRALRSKMSPNGYEMHWGADHPMSIRSQWGIDVPGTVGGRQRSGTRQA